MRRVLLACVLLLWAWPAQAAIAIVGTCNTVNATSVTIPTHSTGDLLIIQSFREASGGGITAPGGAWTASASADADNTSMRVGYQIAASSSQTSGTWTGAEILIACVYSGASGIASTSPVVQSGTATTATYSALTLESDGGAGTSWVFACAISRNQDGTLDSDGPNGGATTEALRGQIVVGGGEAVCWDTNGAVSAWSSDPAGAFSATSYKTSVLEIEATPISTGHPQNCLLLGVCE